MSYLSKPGSRVAHIWKDSRAVSGRLVLTALCPAVFEGPRSTGYFVDRGGRKVCVHCARVARRKALSLLKLAAGEDA